MKKRLEKYIEAALVNLPSSPIVKNNEIENKYSGYISSFGAAVINNGLLPAYLFYSKDKHHKHILDEIMKIIVSCETTDEKEMLKYYQNNKSEGTVEKIMDAATALKLSIRTYTLTKPN